ncbi:MAG: hypothetical protein JXB62_05655 [Pirellulales bacterium]|nr:hypothetical protein [Pirellulales bacterium]
MKYPVVFFACTLVALLSASCLAEESLPAPGTHGHYAVLTATPHRPPPFLAVDLRYGPREDVEGTPHVWWQLEVRAEERPESAPLFQLRALTQEDPVQADDQPLHFVRYLLRIPETGETLEYRTTRFGRALLPSWRDFSKHFVPHRARTAHFQQGIPETCRYLGHVLTLRYAGHGVAWEPWNDTTVLSLNPELLVGTGRSFKDAEGHRLPQQPQRQNYTYVPFTAEDYPVMIDAGINLFCVTPAQEQYVQDEPVFYLRKVDGDPALRFPADLYRSNYVGTVMFMDEPTIIMMGDELIHNSLRYFSDAAALIPARVESRYQASGSYGSYNLEAGLKSRGVEFGSMRLQQIDYPSWETVFETAHYQMEGGVAGIVHEGRYQLAPFDAAVSQWLGEDRRHTAEELLRYHYAFLRGATRPFGKSWGTSIYGQCDPKLAEQAVTLAYDMGARYVWFWTSDHDHHLPWPEQLDLARRLKQHAEAHPRRCIFGPPPVLDRAIVIPDGYFLSLGNLWWVRVLDREGKNEASLRYRCLMQNALRAYHDALAESEDFDFVIDSQPEIQGYRRIVRVSDAAE